MLYNFIAMYGVKNMNYVTVHCKMVPAWKLKVDILNIFFNHQETTLDSEICIISIIIILILLHWTMLDDKI